MTDSSITSLPPGWQRVPFAEAVVPPVGVRGNKVPTRAYQARGRFPIVDQGAKRIAGWTDDPSVVISEGLPYVVFGDHTRSFKYADQPFALGADGTQLLKPAPTIDSRFFYYACLALEIPNRGYNRHFRILKELYVVRPSEPEQRKIASLLRHVERAIDLEERAVVVSRELKQATINQLFTLGLRGEPQKQTEIGPMPQSWTTLAVQRLLDSLRYGTSVKCGYGDGYPVLRIPNVVDGQIVLADVKRGELSAEECDNLRLRDGDILFVRTNGVRERVGSTAVYHGQPEFALFASYLIRARLREGAIDPDFFHYFTASDAGTAQLSGQSSPAADGKFNINTKTIGAMIVPTPEASEQREIVGILQAINQKIDLHERTLASLRELFDGLLHDLMTGRVRVDDLQEMALDDGVDAAAVRRDGTRVCLLDKRDGNPDDVADRTPEERLAMMWQLTRDAWAFTKHPDRAESRLQRHVVRAHRRER